VRAEYVWDGERNGWDRFQIDESHPRPESATVDGSGAQVAPQPFRRSIADGAQHR
jgi:hypothetical protein